MEKLVRPIIVSTICLFILVGIYIALFKEQIHITGVDENKENQDESYYFLPSYSMDSITIFDKRNANEIATIKLDENTHFQQAIWAPSSWTLALLLGTNQGGFALELFDVSTNKIEKFSLGNAPRYVGCTYLNAWSLEKNIILVTSSMCEGPQNFYYVDMNAATKKFIKIPNIEHEFGTQFSDNGNYILHGIRGVNEDCTVTEMGGGTPSIYGVYNPITGKQLGEFGEIGRGSEILGFTFDEREVIYATVAAEDLCKQNGSRRYFRKTLEGYTKAVPLKQTNAFEILKKSHDQSSKRGKFISF